MRPLQEAQLRDAKSHEQGVGSRALNDENPATSLTLNLTAWMI